MIDIAPPPTVNGERFDLIVVGAGSAGFAAAITAADSGKQVGLVNTGPLGGTCTNRGCIPSKALIRAAESWRNAGQPRFAGLSTTQVSLDWKQLQSQKDELIGDLRRARYSDVLTAYPSITLLDGDATFQSDNQIRIGGYVARADKYIVATGARPYRPELPGLADVEPLDSTSLMELTELPDSLIVLGGRAVALELGQMMARFGVKVTIVQRSGRLVPDHEPDIGDAIAGYLSEDGIQVVTGASIQRLSRDGDTRVVHTTVMGRDREYRAGQILLAMGRQPNTNDLDLDAVGVKTDPSGTILVDHYQRTTNPDIYAAGDVTTAPEYVYVAAAAGKVAARNAFTDKPTPLDLTTVPGVIFTDPQIATVGRSEADAAAAGHDTRSATINMEHLARAHVGHDMCGLIKLVADSTTGRLLGAHIVTPKPAKSCKPPPSRSSTASASTIWSTHCFPTSPTARAYASPPSASTRTSPSCRAASDPDLHALFLTHTPKVDNMAVIRSILLFVLAAVAEIGGAWLVWQGWREHRGLLWIAAGVVALGAYGFVATFQPDPHFGRILAAYGGVFVAGSLAWGMLLDGFRPDKWDLIGATICLIGVATIMYAPRST